MRKILDMKKETSNKNLKEELGYKNDLAVPVIKKIVINVGVGRLSQQPNFEEKILPELVKSLALGKRGSDYRFEDNASPQEDDGFFRQINQNGFAPGPRFSRN